MFHKPWARTGAGSNLLHLIYDTAILFFLKPTCFSSVIIWPHSFQFSWLTLTASSGFLILFPSQLPFGLRSFLLFSLFLFLSSAIHFSLSYFCSPSLCVPYTSTARTWCWQQKPPVPLGKPCSSVPVNFTANQRTVA